MSLRCVCWHACQCLYVLIVLTVTVQKKPSLSLYLSSLRVLHLLGFAHIHKKILQQPLGLCQVICILLLVEQALILRITLFVLNRSEKRLYHIVVVPLKAFS